MASERPQLRIGLIGTGFMGKTHVFGFAAAQRVFDLPYELVLHTVADRTEELAAQAARDPGFRAGERGLERVWSRTRRSTSSTSPRRTPSTRRWRSPPSPPASTSIARSRWRRLRRMPARWPMRRKRPGVRTQVGFNYLCNPMLGLAREMIAAGELGEIRSYRGVHAEDYMADAESPFSFRHDPVGGGALGGSGQPCAGDGGVSAWPDGRGARRLRHRHQRAVRTAGAGTGPSRSTTSAAPFCASPAARSGSIEASWIATGRKMQHDFEVYGTKGALAFSQERFNELHFYSTADARRPAWLSPHRGRAGSRSLRPLLRRTGPPARLQRSEGYRGRAVRRRDRRKARRAFRLPGRPTHPGTR